MIYLETRRSFSPPAGRRLGTGSTTDCSHAVLELLCMAADEVLDKCANLRRGIPAAGCSVVVISDWVPLSRRLSSSCWIEAIGA